MATIRFVNVIEVIVSDYARRRHASIRQLLAMITGSEFGHLEQWYKDQGFRKETIAVIDAWVVSKRSRKLRKALHNMKNLDMPLAEAAATAKLKQTDLEAAVPYAKNMEVDSLEKTVIRRPTEGDGDTQMRFPMHDC